MTEREEFEKWVNHGWPGSNLSMDAAWFAWQACAELKDEQLADARKDWKAYTETIMADGSKRTKELEDALRSGTRETIQEAGNHPSPCARFCESNAYEIELRWLKRRVEELEKQLKTARNDALEEAARACMNQDGIHDAIYAESIRDMKEE